VSPGALGLLALAVALEVAAFPPLGAWPLAFVMLAPVAAYADGAGPRRAFAFTWLQQTLAGAFVVRWLLHALAVEYGAPLASSVVFVALLAGTGALVPAAAVALYAALRPRAAAWAAPLLFAALYGLAEALRAEPLLLPWHLVAHPLAAAPLLVQGAEIGGAYLPGFVAVASGAGLAGALRTASALPLAAPALLLALTLGLGTLRMDAPPAGTPVLRVGVVQAAVPQAERFQPGSALRNTERHALLTRRLAASAPLDLVVWSETSVDDDLDAHPELGELLRETAAAIGVPIVTGAPRSAGGRRTNAVVRFDASGFAGSYDKQRLVPFAEADSRSFGFLAPLLGPVSDGESYVPGHAAQVFSGPIPFATPICFEITDPALVRRFRAAGARLILNLSNDAWFGPTGYAEMHLAHAVFRAVELRSFVVRGTNTGISAVIDPSGRVTARLGLFEEGTLSAEVGPAAAPTFYARFGSAPCALAFGACAALAALTGGGRGAGRGRSGPRDRGARRGGRRGGSPRSPATRRRG
jgi:apolipoprotein N-acyltransferase